MKNKPTFQIKSWIKCCIIFIFFLMIFFPVAQSNQTLLSNDITVSYSFASPTLETIDIAGTLYNRVNLRDCYPAGNTGEPKLPSKGAFLLLPQDSKIDEIAIITGEKIILESTLLIEPTSQAFPMSQIENPPIPTPNTMIYHSNQVYPGNLFTQIGVYHFRGYQILVLLLHPVQYNPSTGELFYYTSMDVVVKTSNTGITSVLYRDLSQDNKEVQLKVDNPDISSSYTSHDLSSLASLDAYDLLIITTDALRNSFRIILTRDSPN